MNKINYDFRNLDEITSFFAKYKLETKTDESYKDAVDGKETIIRHFVETHKNEVMKHFDAYLKENLSEISGGTKGNDEELENECKSYTDSDYDNGALDDLGIFTDDYFYGLFKDNENLGKLYGNDHKNELKEIYKEAVANY